MVLNGSLKTLRLLLFSISLFHASNFSIQLVEQTSVSVVVSKYLLKHLGHERTFLVQFTVYLSDIQNLLIS